MLAKKKGIWLDVSYESLEEALLKYGPVRANWMDYLYFDNWNSFVSAYSRTRGASLPLYPLMILTGEILYYLKEYHGFELSPINLAAILISPGLIALMYLHYASRGLRIKAYFIEHDIEKKHRIGIRLYYTITCLSAFILPFLL
jgi:hypothetical protein